MHSCLGYDLVHAFQNNRTKIVLLTGESGSGKTVNAKHLLQFISKAMKSEELSQRLLFANPILEFFGNAKTLMNSNSSRFCKFIQVYTN